MIQFVFWVVMPCSDVVGYQSSYFILKMESTDLKFWYPMTMLHGITTNSEDPELNLHCHENLKSHFKTLH